MSLTRFTGPERVFVLVITCLIIMGSGFHLFHRRGELVLEVEPVLQAEGKSAGEPLKNSNESVSEEVADGNVGGKAEMGSEPKSHAELEAKPNLSSSSSSVQKGSVRPGETKRVGEEASSVQSSESSDISSGRVNINTATAAELEALPGIGPVLAARIIRYREEVGPFFTVEQLQEVKGIGSKTLKRLLPLVTVGKD